MTTHQKIHSSLRYFFLSLGLAASLCTISQAAVSSGSSLAVTPTLLCPATGYDIECICVDKNICLLGGRNCKEQRPAIIVINMKTNKILYTLEQTEGDDKILRDSISTICRIVGRVEVFATGSNEGVLSFWKINKEAGKFLCQFGEYFMITSLCCGSDGRLAFVDYQRVYVLDRAKHYSQEHGGKGLLLFGKDSRCHLAYDEQPSVVCWDSGGRLAHSSGPSIVLYDGKGRSIQKLWTFPGEKGKTVESLVFLQDGQKIAAASGYSTTITIWHVASKSSIRLHGDHAVRSLCVVPLFLPTANGLLIQGYCRCVGKRISQGVIHIIREYTEKEFLAAGTQSGIIQCWDVKKKKKIDQLCNVYQDPAIQLSCSAFAGSRLLHLTLYGEVFRWLLKPKKEGWLKE